MSILDYFNDRKFLINNDNVIEDRIYGINLDEGDEDIEADDIVSLWEHLQLTGIARGKVFFTIYDFENVQYQLELDFFDFFELYIESAVLPVEKKIWKEIWKALKVQWELEQLSKEKKFKQLKRKLQEWVCNRVKCEVDDCV